jgi:hypothetical protein
MYYAQFVSFFTLITHAATIASMRPYFRKYPKMTTTQVCVMLLGYAIWLFANAVIFGVLIEIEDARWYKPATPAEDTIRIRHSGLTVVFAFEFSLITWVCSSMLSPNP